VVCVVAPFVIAFLCAPLVKIIVEHTLYAERAEYDFARVFRRIVQAAAVLLALVHWRALRVRARLALAFARDRRPLVDLAAGMAMIVAAVVLFNLLAWAQGSMVASGEELRGTDVLKICRIAASTGLVEEVLFTAILLAALVDEVGVVWALVLRGLLFASIHLLREDFDVTHGFEPWIGINGLINSVAPLLRPLWWHDALEMVGLFVFSSVLGLAWLRTRRIWLPLGLHSGAILATRLDGYWLDKGSDPSWWMVGIYSSFGSPMAFGVLAILGWLIWRWPLGGRRGADESRSGEPDSRGTVSASSA
jgi:membrane protease YdiL (CAAX protease family)